MDDRLPFTECKTSDAVEGARGTGLGIVLPRSLSGVDNAESKCDRTRDEATIKLIRHVVYILVDLVDKM